MKKFLGYRTDIETRASIPEIRLLCAVLKRAIDDVLHYADDTNAHKMAVEWLSQPGDECEYGSLSNVVANITGNRDLHDTVLRRIQKLIQCRDQLVIYKRSCIKSAINRYTGQTAKKANSKQ